MALTPEDLLSKDFPETKFRPGYDKDEVDDFLDEIVVEWRRILQENEDLTKRVTSLQEQLDNSPDHVEPDDLKDAGLSGYAGSSAEVTGTVPSVPAEEPGEEPATTATSPVTAYPEYELGTRPAQVREEAPAAATPAPEELSATTGAVSGSANEAAGVLAMAQRLHDQYVAQGEETRAQYIAEGEQTRAQYISEGETQRESLITDGQTQHDQLISEGETKRTEMITEGETTREQYLNEAETKRTAIVSDAESRAENMIEEAELTSTRTLNALEKKKSELETRVSELTSFERDYRARLKDYIESQLADLNTKNSIENEAAGE